MQKVNECLTVLLHFSQSSLHGANTPDAGRAYQPPGSERCHLAE